MQLGKRWVLVCGVVLSLASGCLNSNYMPQTPGRVYMMMQNNKVVYVRDGQTYKEGFFGGGLADVVRGVPEAEAAAGEFVSRRRSGIFIVVAGTVCSGVALGFMGKSIADEGDNSDAIVTTSLIAAGCAVGAYVGLWRFVSAEPYKYDAINIFNDANLTPGGDKPPSSWDVGP